MKMKTESQTWWAEAADEARDVATETRARAALLAGARERRDRRGAWRRAMACAGAAAVLALAAMLWPKGERVVARTQVASGQSVVRPVERAKPLVPEISQAELAEWLPHAAVAVVRRDGRAELILVPKIH